jgi:magnesium transporter
MNQIMKTLTVISIIFIPLTFIAGIYGTNFTYVPEFHWKYGYAYLWGLCLTIVAIEIIVYKKLRIM